MFVNNIYFYTFDPWLLAALYDQWITILHAARHGCRLLKHGIRLCNDDEISRERAKQKATWISIVRLMVLLLILESKHSSGATTKRLSSLRISIQKLELCHYFLQGVQIQTRGTYFFLFQLCSLNLQEICVYIPQTIPILS